ncbi:MAG: hypothetical protein M1118_00380 [Chloroflexi bacterium]|nr:hypothetical protein [Chloroflexota bacterium]
MGFEPPQLHGFPLWKSNGGGATFWRRFILYFSLTEEGGRHSGGCPTTHYQHEAGKAWLAIPPGIIARVGRVVGQCLALPLGFVRADLTVRQSSTRQTAGFSARQC